MERSKTANLQLLQEDSASNAALEIQVTVLAACARMFTSSCRVITPVTICNKISPVGTWIWTAIGNDIWVVLRVSDAIPFLDLFILKSSNTLYLAELTGGCLKTRPFFFLKQCPLVDLRYNTPWLKYQLTKTHSWSLASVFLSVKYRQYIYSNWARQWPGCI